MACHTYTRLPLRYQPSPAVPPFKPWTDTDRLSDSVQSVEDDGPSTSYTVSNIDVRAWLTPNGIKLIPASIGCWPLWQVHRLPTFVPFTEMLSAKQGLESKVPCCWNQVFKLDIYTFQRPNAGHPCEWQPCKLVLTTPDQAVVEEWEGRITKALNRIPTRPKHLLVLVNPYGGARQAPWVWATTAQPLFQLAGIKCTVLETSHAGHAAEHVAGLAAEETAALDGIVAVGGDGLFSEVLNAVLALRHAASDPGARVHSLRLGHIPAGSTDAVGYSWHGTRCRSTAALHIALGDRIPLDVMRVEAQGLRLGARFAACVASYGYMGDLLRTSERLRVLGPSRYQLAGAATLLRGRWYEADIAFRPVLPARPSAAAEDCRAGCQRCSSAQQSRRDLLRGAPSGDGHGQHGEEHFAQSSDHATADGWEHRRGRFMSIMVVVTPCRSSMSTSGLVASSHLADGALHLVLVHKCSWPLYLKFLTTIPRSGALPSKSPLVEVLECTAVRVQPQGRRSAWNVDGELLQPECFEARMCSGLVDVFARGVE